MSDAEKCVLHVRCRTQNLGVRLKGRVRPLLFWRSLLALGVSEETLKAHRNWKSELGEGEPRAAPWALPRAPHFSSSQPTSCEELKQELPAVHVPPSRKGPGSGQEDKLQGQNTACWESARSPGTLSLIRHDMFWFLWNYIFNWNFWLCVDWGANWSYWCMCVCGLVEAV